MFFYISQNDKKKMIYLYRKKWIKTQRGVVSDGEWQKSKTRESERDV